MIHLAPKHRMIGIPHRPEFDEFFPEAKKVTVQGNELVVVPHEANITRYLRNIGMEVPAPISIQYDWENGSPFEVQKKTAAMLTMNARAYVLNGMGTGKTKAALWSWRFLNRTGQAGKLLVVAPLSTLNFTWAREIFNTLPGVRVQVLHGRKDKRLARLDDPNVDVYVINHDGLGVIADALARRPDVDTCILDELAVYRNGTAARTKVTRKVTARMRWLWGMTGSPTPNAPTDAWSQCSIITPTTVPRYFNRFRDEVMNRVTQFKFTPKPDALDKVFEVMQPAVRFTLDDVVELPELVERTIDIDMGPKQAKVYKQMEDHAHAMVASNEITAMNAGAVLMKLLQISTGYVYSKDKSVVSLDNDDRLTALVDTINACSQKIIVFVPFIHALTGIADRLAHEGYDYRIVSGNTNKGERDEIFNLFQNSNAIKVLLAHPQCMAHGLTLTAADTIIWFAPIPNLEIFEQANARIRRVGQKHKQQVLMFQATKAERKMYAKLRAKQKVQNALLDMFADGTE